MLYLIVILSAMSLIILVNVLLNSAFYNLDFWYIVLAVVLNTISVIVVSGLVAILVRQVLPEKWFNEMDIKVSKKEMRFYEKLGVKKWKDLVPELGFFTGFRKNKIANPKSIEYVDNRAIECFFMEKGKVLFHLELKTFLIHDIKNALAAVATCRAMGIEPALIKQGLEGFSGIKRRNEIMGKIGNCLIYADYAHHPEQLKNTIKMLDLKYENYALFFQSHTFSRTANLYKDFLSALSSVSNLFIFDTYGAREKYNYLGSAKRLSEDLKGCVYCGDVKNAKAILNSVSARFDCIAILGAGNLYDEVERSL